MAVLDRVKARLDAWEDVLSDEWLAEVSPVRLRPRVPAGRRRKALRRLESTGDATVKAVNRRA